MKVAFALLVVVLAATAFAAFSPQTPTNPDNSIIMEQERPSPSLFDTMWNTLTKYYRYAKRKIHCYVWGQECRPKVTSPTSTTKNDPFANNNVESNWFEKINSPPSTPPMPVSKIQDVVKPVESKSPFHHQQQLIDLDAIVSPKKDNAPAGKKN